MSPDISVSQLCCTIVSDILRAQFINVDGCMRKEDYYTLLV